MNLVKQIEKLKIGKVETKVDLRKCTTYKAGGKADIIVSPKSTDKLIELLKLLQQEKVDFKILGNGSNLVFSDKPYKNVLIKLSELNECTIDDTVVKVGAGHSLIALATKTAKLGLTGLEFATGIPGTVGGAVYMNAGAYKSDMGYVVSEVTLLTPELKVITMYNKALNFKKKQRIYMLRRNNCFKTWR